MYQYPQSQIRFLNYVYDEKFRSSVLLCRKKSVWSLLPKTCCKIYSDNNRWHYLLKVMESLRDLLHEWNITIVANEMFESNPANHVEYLKVPIWIKTARFLIGNISSISADRCRRGRSLQWLRLGLKGKMNLSVHINSTVDFTVRPWYNKPQ